jgi:hypothetical protein
LGLVVFIGGEALDGLQARNVYSPRPVTPIEPLRAVSIHCARLRRNVVRRLLQLAVVLALSASLGSCVNPSHEVAQVEEIVAIGQAITTLQSYINDLELRIDSLVGAIASQDTAIRRTAEFVGLVLPGREGR